MHAVSTTLEAGELELLGHPAHALEPAAEYVPAPQFVHVAVPGVPLNFPATQSVHAPPFGPDEPALQVQAISAELEAGEYELPGHATHTLATVAPAVTEYVPAVQFVHTVATVAPVTAEYVPAPQFVHVADPVVSLNFPAAHTLHVPPLGPLWPTLHVHAPSAELEIGEFEFPGHDPHTFAVAPTAVENLPASQSEHALP